MPKRSGTPRTRSRPWLCSSKISADGVRRQQPHAAGLAAQGQHPEDAGHRAGVPVAVERTQFRVPPGGRVRGAGVGHRSGEGLVHRTFGVQAGQVEGQRRRRGDRRDPVPVGLGRADLEVGAERAGDLLRDEGLQGLAGQAAHQLTDQVALILRVITRRGARFPPRCLGGELAGGGVPVVHVLGRERRLPAGHAGGVAEDVPDLDAFLAVLGELRPVLRDRRVGIELSPRSISIRAARLVTVLVVDQTLVMVFSVQGVRCSSSRQPPQRSTTVRPSTSTAMLAPVSWPESSCSASASRTGSNRASQVPGTSTTGVSPSSLNDMARRVAAGR